jgi:prepilin-type N-terminal cleavage/methylation domain-containing protein
MKGHRTNDRHSRGFTLIELMFTVAIMGIIGTGFAKLLSAPMKVGQYIQTAQQLKVVASGTDLVVNDLKEADPSSVPWGSLSPATTSWSQITFNKVSYDLAMPTSPVTTSYFYSYQFPCAVSTSGCLMRSDGTTSIVVMPDLDTPTADNPLFRMDPNPSNYHMITMTFLYHPSGQSQTRLVRQVAIKG